MHRIAADRRIREGVRSGGLDELAAENLAVQHQLVTRLTNYVLTIDRGDARATSLPVTRPVSHMLAAGWSGTSIDAMAHMEVLSSSFEAATVQARFDAPERSIRARDFVAETNQRFGSILSSGVLPLRLDPILSMGMPASVGDLLRGLVNEGHSEGDVIRAFWAAFAVYLNPARTERGLARKLKVASKAADRVLVARILAELQLMEVTQ